MMNETDVTPPTEQRAFERGDHAELAARLLECLSVGRSEAPLFDDGGMCRYEASTGLWERIESAEQSRIIQSFAGASIQGERRGLRIRAGDVNGTIKLASDRASRLGFFANAPPGLAFVNGFARVVAGKVDLAPHSPEWRARAGYSFPFDPSAPVHCPQWASFLLDLFRDDEDCDGKIAFFQQFTGACLLGLAPRYQRTVVFVGDGDNGKSTLLEVVSAMMPDGAYCSIPPQDWGDEYRIAMLTGKRLNAVSELPEADILESEAFKKIVTGDVTMARNIREAPFQFTPMAGHIFAANTLPGATDMTEGFWRRFVVMRFSRRFLAHEKRPGIAREIIEAERPGIVSWMLRGADRVLVDRGYTLPRSAAAELADWRRRADNVVAFFEARTRDVQEGEDWTLGAVLYASYRSWTVDSGYRAVSIQRFADRAKAHGKGAEHGRDGSRYPVVLLPAMRARDGA